MPLLRCGSVAVLLLVLHLGACASWRPVAVAPEVLIAEGQPGWIRVTDADGRTAEVEKPVILNDSIAASLQECRTSVAGGGRYGCVEGMPRTVIALEDVHGVEVKRLNPARTFRAIMLAGLFIAVMDAAANFDVGLH